MPRRGPHIQYPLLHDPEWLRRRYVEENVGLKAIADEVGCTRSMVLRALGMAGIDVSGRFGPKRQWEPTREDLIEEYRDAGSLQELAERRGLSIGTIRNIFYRLHIRPADVDMGDGLFVRFPQLADKEWLERELYEKGTALLIAEEIGCRREHVAEAAHRHGLQLVKGRGTPQAVKDRAVRLYTAGNSLATVSRLVGYDPAGVWRWLKAAGVDTSQRKSKGVDEETRARVVDLLGRLPNKVIADIVGVSASTVNTIRAEYGTFTYDPGKKRWESDSESGE